MQRRKVFDIQSPHVTSLPLVIILAIPLSYSVARHSTFLDLQNLGFTMFLATLLYSVCLHSRNNLHILGWSVAVVVTLASLVILGRKAFFCPLSRIPGTWHSFFSNFGVFFSVVRLRKLGYIETLFNQHGSVVRIGPNKVCFLYSCFGIPLSYCRLHFVT